MAYIELTYDAHMISLTLLFPDGSTDQHEKEKTERGTVRTICPNTQNLIFKLFNCFSSYCHLFMVVVYSFQTRLFLPKGTDQN